MINFTTSDGFSYHIDDIGIIHQNNPEIINYTEDYIDTYRTPEYQKQSALLMGIRLGSLYSIYTSIFDSTPNSLLDIGYGDGSFLYAASNLINECTGTDVTGVELKDPVKTFKYNSNLTFPFYDVVTLWDVYEHLPDLSVINNIRTKMICISMPDVSNQNFDTWKHRKPNEHIHHFTPDTLKKYMEKFHYKCVYQSWQEDAVRKSNTPNNIMTLFFTK